MKNLTHLALAASLSMSAVAVHQASQVSDDDAPSYRITIEGDRDRDSITFKLVAQSGGVPSRSESFYLVPKALDELFSLEGEERDAALQKMRAVDFLSPQWNRLFGLRNSEVLIEAYEHYAKEGIDGELASSLSAWKAYSQVRDLIWADGAELVYRMDAGSKFEEIWMK